jgi:hypothetical protein
MKKKTHSPRLSECLIPCLTPIEIQCRSGETKEKKYGCRSGETKEKKYPVMGVEVGRLKKRNIQSMKMTHDKGSIYMSQRVTTQHE